MNLRTILKYTGRVFLCTIPLCFYSFQQINSGVDPEEYKAAYRQNQDKFIKTLDLKKVQYSIQYVPVELKILNMQESSLLTKSEKDEIYSDYRYAREFLLQISVSGYNDELLKYDVGNDMNYTDRVSYLSFEMKNDIKFVLDQNDTVSCSEYVFERNFGTSPKGSFVIGFETKKKYKNIEILMNDRLFRNEHLSFEFDAKDMRELPKLKNN